MALPYFPDQKSYPALLQGSTMHNPGISNFSTGDLNRPSNNSGNEFDAHGSAATPDNLARSLGSVGDQCDTKFVSDPNNDPGHDLRTDWRDVDNLAFAILALALKRNPGRLTPTSAYRLAPNLALFAWLGHPAFLQQKS
jgi:hypothetical protein